jgi:sulfur carrier protein
VTTVTLNGRPRELPRDATVEAAVREAGAPEAGRGVAVAVDGEVVRHTEWETTTLGNRQAVEVVRAVQGG